jgi:DNA-binding CsgD family transcriptional regulator
LARLADLPPATTLLAPDQVFLAAARGVLQLVAGDEAEALVDLRAVEVAIRHGRALAGFAPIALAMLAEAELACGSWDDAAAHANLAVSVAEAENRAAMSAACLARARGDPQAMLDALDILVSIDCPFRRGEWQVWRAEALLGTGQADDADQIAATLVAEPGSVALHARLVHSEAARARSDPATARRALAALIDAVPTSQAFLRARVDLARGALLLTSGAEGSGQAALQRAYSTFSGLGAQPWAEHCQQILMRHGQTSEWRHQTSQLSDRERQVAHLVASGLSNGEAAERLYVSRKAIEFHLTNVYQKLGISSRRALASELALTGVGPILRGN